MKQIGRGLEDLFTPSATSSLLFKLKPTEFPS